MHGTLEKYPETDPNKQRENFVYLYARNDDVPDWVALGWTRMSVLDGTHHGYYAAVVAWMRDDEPQYLEEYNERIRNRA